MYWVVWTFLVAVIQEAGYCDRTFYFEVSCVIYQRKTGTSHVPALRFPLTKQGYGNTMGAPNKSEYITRLMDCQSNLGIWISKPLFADRNPQPVNDRNRSFCQ
ncbi:MAG TPA: hypothetical protein DIU35_04805 [Candidatus Latescibacteria bacterium]|nr:hypothetical protein [Candidatus Latescibacterota bacterium]